MGDVKILCIIPARSGSKGIPDKNIKLFRGLPLLAWSIKQAEECKYKMRIIVSTDYECIKHCVSWLKVNENYNPNIILQLRPTQPCRKVKDINKCLDLFLSKYNEYDSLRTVIEFEKSPFKMYTIDKDQKLLKPLFDQIDGIKEPYNQCRQILPKTYLHNGYIDIIKTIILNNGSLSGKRLFPYIMDKNNSIDIDTMKDWVKAEKYNKSLV